MNLNEIFVDNGIYKLKDTKENIFLCEKLSESLGKLVLFKEISRELYERTSISYFLNTYKEGDIKELFVNRENYDMVGKLNSNYLISDDKKFVKLVK